LRLLDLKVLRLPPQLHLSNDLLIDNNVAIIAGVLVLKLHRLKPLKDRFLVGCNLGSCLGLLSTHGPDSAIDGVSSGVEAAN
jgi:hypothetical protein